LYIPLLHARNTSNRHAPTHKWLAKVAYFGGLCVGALPGPGAVLGVGPGPDGADVAPDVGPDASPDGAGAGPDVGPEASPDGASPGSDASPDESPDGAGSDVGPDGAGPEGVDAGPGPDVGPDGEGASPDGAGPGPDVSIGPDEGPDAGANSAGPGPGLVGSVVAPEAPVAVCAAAPGMVTGVEDDDGAAAGAGAASLPEVSIGAGPVLVLPTAFGCSFNLMGICRPRDAP
jgi:hypothetical protein